MAKERTSERVLKILMDKVRKGEKLSKHEREILSVVTHEALKKDHKRKTHHKKKTHHKTRRHHKKKRKRK